MIEAKDKRANFTFNHRLQSGTPIELNTPQCIMVLVEVIDGIDELRA
jgi:hypothetical protein